MAVTLTFNSPIYGPIRFTNPVLIALIKTWPVQRLRQIGQMGAVRLINFAPDHNRFNHAIQVAFLIQYLFKHNRAFASVSLQLKLETMIAGLLHDIGHGPFSHDFEKNFFSFQHEQQSSRLINDPTGPIYPILIAAQLDVKRITNLILGQTQHDLLQTLISGQFDLDRLDYLLHDIYYLRFDYPSLDWKQLLLGLRIQTNQLAFKLTALPTVEHYLQMRAALYRQQFWSTKNLFMLGLFQKLWQRLDQLRQTRKLTEVQLQPYTSLWNLTSLTATQFQMWNDQQLLKWLQQLDQQLADPLFSFLLVNFLHPTFNQEQLILQRLDWLEQVKSTQLKHYQTFTHQLATVVYEVTKKPIYFIESATGKLIRLDQVSTIFPRTLIMRSQQTLQIL